MTIRQLEAFLTVARERNFSVAARRLHVSQPTLSEHVAELEKELGAKLFVRTGRGIGLTEGGRVFEAYAGRVVSTVGDARRAMQELDGLERGVLELGASTTPGIYLLPGLIAVFRADYPGIELRVHIGNSRGIEERVQTNELDLGIVGGHELMTGERCLEAGVDDELFLVVPPGHAWARSRALPPARLAEAQVLLREEGSATRRVTERALQQAGVTYRPGLELGHTEAIKQGVMAGLGVAVLSVYTIRREVARGDLVALRLRGLRIQRHFHVIHNEGRLLTASARAFMDALSRQKPPALRPPRQRGRLDPPSRSVSRVSP